MLEIIRSADRGQAQFGWLTSKHSFSFGHYYNPKQMGFSALRV
ncbi:pirin family protein, partial [Alishewanella sp. SMS9]|nr:pirin family protein [Alishewanella sp. SMS9]